MNKYILSVGHMEFPLGQAQVQRQLLISKALILQDYEVLVLCRYGIHNSEDRIESKGVYEGISYVYCSGTTVRPDNFFKRNLLKIKGLLTEIRYFKSMTKNRQLAGTFISTNNFQNILFYYLIGKIFKTTTVVDTVEYWTANKNIKGLERIDKYLYDKFYFLFTDRVICISDFLIKKVWTSKKPYILKVPSITDFDKFSNNNGAKLIDERYFLYCGSDAYFEVIDFVIVSFDRLNKDGVLLVLVTNDSEKIRQRISLSKRNKFIRLLTNQPYSDLVNLYKNSEGLIIPMRNSDQDKARFPHKISEYCASKRPIITNNVGEIKNYFNHNNAYLCNDMNEQEFADKMEEIISDPSKADIIGSNSFQTGIVNFNYKSYSKPITELFNKQ